MDSKVHDITMNRNDLKLIKEAIKAFEKDIEIREIEVNPEKIKEIEKFKKKYRLSEI